MGVKILAMIGDILLTNFGLFCIRNVETTGNEESPNTTIYSP
jgi:hypothetical protein